MTPVTQIIGKIVSDYQNGIYPDRDQKRFAFYERLEFEAEAFEKWLNDENPFYSFERYSDEPITYEDADTDDEWHKWLAEKGISMRDEYQ
ncbi:hypothetical protein FVF58_09400 [Paraburkholderia panacisoli]|uniref:Uncharacterized protein n=1 Tax=Paraburkholderia panacisoli TaxID=2603818 RepID=A0A5B0HCR8_9BURK|nr:hypothetical protein [Paraburkholderia panacisoli]KAA1012997.1 hypothetical protein FVF58_09400 [Paraburkholderia panacisoli]